MSISSSGAVPLLSNQAQVLIVDDYADNRLVLKILLQLWGTFVLEAGNGLEAVEVVRRELPQLVLMDLSMPLMDGFEATRLLKSTPDTMHIPIVAISAHCSDPRVCAQALAAGCVDCIGKPMDLKKVEALLRTFTQSATKSE
ncbi:response regulator [bacterium]|nr:MAG: response regulator [bacterium]